MRKRNQLRLLLLLALQKSSSIRSEAECLAEIREAARLTRAAATSDYASYFRCLLWLAQDSAESLRQEERLHHAPPAVPFAQARVPSRSQSESAAGWRPSSLRDREAEAEENYLRAEAQQEREAAAARI